MNIANRAVIPLRDLLILLGMVVADRIVTVSSLKWGRQATGLRTDLDAVI